MRNPELTRWPGLRHRLTTRTPRSAPQASSAQSSCWRPLLNRKMPVSILTRCCPACFAGVILLLTSQADGHDRSSTAPGPMSQQTVQSRADALLQQMSPEDKAAQLTQYFYFQMFPPLAVKLAEAVEKGQVGSLL